jgi:hypothetical protein
MPPFRLACRPVRDAECLALVAAHERLVTSKAHWIDLSFELAEGQGRRSSPMTASYWLLIWARGLFRVVADRGDG